MADNAPATAADFITNYGVAPDVAESLAKGANDISGRNGSAARAEAEHSMDNYVPPSPAAPEAKPTTQELTDAANAHDATSLNATFDTHFAPPASPNDYRSTYLDTPTEETIAADTQLRESVHADRVPNSLFTLIDSDIVAAQRRQETPQQRDARMNVEADRTEKMWGGKFEENISIIREAVDKVSGRTREAFNAAWPHLSPISRDEVLTWAKYRTGRALL